MDKKRKIESEEKERERQLNIQEEENASRFYQKCYEFHIKETIPVFSLFTDKNRMAAIYIDEDKGLNFLRIDGYTQEEDKLHLLTAHDSKGKEFPVVLIYGVDEFEKGDMQEERRLLYVAMTRAQNMLYMTEICKGKSMFLKELQDNMDVFGGMDYA